MEQRFKRVRKQLDDLGYMQVLVPEALPLVEKLTADLIQTTESLQKYKKIAKDALEEQDNLQLGAEPYKCDNAKLVRECNDLHLAFLQFREQNEKTQRDLKRRLSTLEKEKLDCEAECEKLKRRIRDLECESAKKSDRILAFQNKNLQAGGKSSSVAISKSRSSTASKSNTEISTTMALADQKIASLTKEIQNLRDEHLQLTEMSQTYKNQLNNRDREIQRLNQMLEGGRPIQALNQDCCYKDVEGQLYRMQKEVNSLEKEKSELEIRLKESVSKQHEAMKRALHLADRNKQLEQELRDIDQMALAVEADCNSTVKMNAEKVSRLQERVHETVLQIQSLERELTELKRDKQELLSDVDALKLEKKHLQTVLETALDEKKRLNDKINQFTVIEHDLNLEIDRLVQTSANQKRKIAELECKLLAGKFDAVTDRSGAPDLESQSRRTSRPRLSQNVSPRNCSLTSNLQNQSPKSSPTRLSKSSSPRKSPMRKSPLRKSQCKSQKTKNKISEDLKAPPRMESQRNKPNKSLPCSLPPKTNKSSKKKSVSRPPKLKSTKPTKSHSPARSPMPTNPQNSPDHSNPSSEWSRSNSVEYPYNNDEAAKKFGGCSCCNCCRCCNESRCKQECNKGRLMAGVDCPCCPCAQSISTIERVKSERDYYMKEYHRLLEQMKNIPSKPDSHTELLQKLHESKQSLATLQHENKTLAQEKHNLMTRLDTARDRTEEDYDGFSLKSSVRRLERERDILKGDITRLEEERDAIRQRLKAATESQVAEHARMEKTLMNSEEQVRKLEQERRELMQSQGSRRATISGLEEQCDTLKNQQLLCQTELNHQRALYTQLKTLHEQTDKALGDSQGQLAQLEAELAKSQDRIRSLEKDRSYLDQEVATLKNDVVLMRGNLAQIDQEKDGLLISLDDKTEKLAMLEQELRTKEDKLLTLENTVAELKKKLSLTMDGSSSKEHLLRSASAESANLRQELEAAMRAKDSAIQENRRMQDDLAACTADCRAGRNELEVCRRQIEDLKRQLQHYVSEVKRFEDLMTQKEVERNELLDQFRSLSQEATLLENNNHSLENEATQSKVQLSVTLDHVADLETKLTSQDGAITSYERQIAELTSQVANLESQLCHCKQQQDRTEADLGSVRDLCMKLDTQKDTLMRELNEKVEQKSQVDRDVLRLRRESETLQNTLTKDRSSVENLERLLAEARQEAVEQRLRNQELETEIRALKERIEDFQSRLSPATATFTYSANIGTSDNKVCTCCGSCTGRPQDDKGDMIDTASAVITRASLKNGSCGESSGQLKAKGQAETTETKLPDWKSHHSSRGSFSVKSGEGKKLMQANEKIQRGGFCRSLCSGPCATHTVEKHSVHSGSIHGSTHAPPTHSVNGSSSYAVPTERVASYSYSGLTGSDKPNVSTYNNPLKSAATAEQHFSFVNSIKADANSLKNNSNLIKVDSNPVKTDSNSVKSNQNSFKQDFSTCPSCCMCNIQAHQQLESHKGSDKFYSNYRASLPQINETEICICTTSCPTACKYTTHYSIANNK